MDNKQHSLILIVDDYPENIQILLQILHSEKYSFAVATCGAEVFLSIEAELPDLILLDVMLPDMDGFEICERLKKDPKTANIPVIFLTAKVEIEDKVRGFGVGAVDYITKPFDENEVTARVTTHLRLQKTEQQLRQLLTTKDKFFSIIAHDLRTPIGSIKSALQLIQNGIIEGDQINFVIKELAQNASQTYDLLENLLFWARSQRQSIEFYPQAIDLHAIIDDVFLLYTHVAQSKQISMQNCIHCKTAVLADKNMLHLILRNLISNALKFCNLEGIIKIECNPHFSKPKDNQRFIQIAVVDNGVGIDAENLPKIFNNNLNFTTFGTQNEKGSGLGLLLCQEFVLKNGGKIWVESTKGVGSRFIFTLPLVVE